MGVGVLIQPHLLGGGSGLDPGPGELFLGGFDLLPEDKGLVDLKPTRELFCFLQSFPVFACSRETRVGLARWA